MKNRDCSFFDGWKKESILNWLSSHEQEVEVFKRHLPDYVFGNGVEKFTLIRDLGL